MQEIYWGNTRRGKFSNIFTSQLVAEFSAGETVFPLKIREFQDEDPGDPYWGWLDSGGDHYAMIWPTEVQLEMCFPYGTAAEISRGKGKVVKLFIEEAK